MALLWPFRSSRIDAGVCVCVCVCVWGIKGYFFSLYLFFFPVTFFGVEILIKFPGNLCSRELIVVEICVPGN